MWAVKVLPGVKTPPGVKFRCRTGAVQPDPSPNPAPHTLLPGSRQDTAKGQQMEYLTARALQVGIATPSLVHPTPRPTPCQLSR
jgi:hypothetical protein